MGKLDGKGKITYPDGRVVQGTFTLGKLTEPMETKTLPECKGKDTMKWTNCFGTSDYQVGDQYGIYEGEWKDGERHGQGTYDDNAGNIYIGEWKYNQRSGEGIQIFSDGSKYEGQWKNDIPIKQYNELLKIEKMKTKEMEKQKKIELTMMSIPILLVVAITVLLKLFVKKFYNYLIVPITKGLLLSNSMKGKASRTEYNIYFLFLILFLAFSMYCLFVISNFFPHLEMVGDGERILRRTATIKNNT